MKQSRIGFDFILKEWLLLASASGLLLSSLFLKRIPSYSLVDFEILFILFVLFVVVKGLGNTGLFLRLAQRIEQGALIPVKLVIATFFLSMFVTNDVALVVVVPLTLVLHVGKKDVLVILEALAANAGSALTPFGNPQNLFLYWFYDLSPGEFFLSIAPFSLVFFGLLVLAALTLRIAGPPSAEEETKGIPASVYAFAALLLITILSVLRVLPVWLGVPVLACSLLLDRGSLAVDYALLASFFCFFGLAENMRGILSSVLTHSEHVFLLSCLSSQIMSNVPAALLFARFTGHWQALLWGTNVGGFGSLVGSLATVIAYKLYITNEETDGIAAFTLKFLLLGYAAFFLGIALYSLVGKGPF